MGAVVVRIRKWEKEKDRGMVISEGNLFNFCQRRVFVRAKITVSEC